MENLDVMVVKAIKNERNITAGLTYYIDRSSILINHGVVTGSVFSSSGVFCGKKKLNWFTYGGEDTKIYIASSEYLYSQGIETKRIRFPIIWKCWGMIDLTVPKDYTNAQILKYFNNIIDDVSLPDGEFVDGSIRSDYTEENIHEAEFKEVK